MDCPLAQRKQLLCSVRDWYFPSGQETQSLPVLFAGLNSPATQATHPFVPWLVVDPVFGVALPAGHNSHDPFPVVGWYLPVGQLLQ